MSVIDRLKFHFISRDYVEIRKLKWAYIVKGVIVAILILLAIAFAVALFTAGNVGGEQSSAVAEPTYAYASGACAQPFSSGPSLSASHSTSSHSSGTCVWRRASKPANSDASGSSPYESMAEAMK